MKLIKVLFIDLDNTLYDYDECNSRGLREVFSFLSEIRGTPTSEISSAYFSANQKIKERKNNIFSHNKFLTFKEISSSINEALSLESVYWDEFFKNVVSYPGVEDFLSYINSKKIKICILTNFTAKEQYQKLKFLKIDEMIDSVISSEDIGEEKPSPIFFLSALGKYNIHPKECVMIGDSLENDIQGSTSVGIFPIFFDKNLSICSKEKFISFSSFREIKVFFEELENSAKENIYLSKLFGGREYTLLGGGNISVKNENFLVVKASGYQLRNLEEGELSFVNLKNGETVFNYLSPSIETSIHLAFPEKYTVHLHPLSVNYILVRKDAREVISKLFESNFYSFVDYFPPGKILAEECFISRKAGKVIFLQNHGIVVLSNTIDEIIEIINFTIEKCEGIIPPNKGLSKTIEKNFLTPDEAVYISSLDENNEHQEDILFSYNYLRSGNTNLKFLTEEEVGNILNRDDEKSRIELIKKLH